MCVLTSTVYDYKCLFPIISISTNCIYFVTSLQFDTHDSHQQVMIQWAGEGSDVIVCVTRDAHQTLDSSHTSVLVSENYGLTYQNRTHLFKTKDGKPSIINKFYKNDEFTNMVCML